MKKNKNELLSPVGSFEGWQAAIRAGARELSLNKWDRLLKKSDGKAMLLKAEMKKGIFIFSLPSFIEQRARKVADVCPTKVIKVG